jgi:hypothetical protein
MVLIGSTKKFRSAQVMSIVPVLAKESALRPEVLVLLLNQIDAFAHYNTT